MQIPLTTSLKVSGSNNPTVATFAGESLSSIDKVGDRPGPSPDASPDFISNIKLGKVQQDGFANAS